MDRYSGLDSDSIYAIQLDGQKTTQLSLETFFDPSSAATTVSDDGRSALSETSFLWSVVWLKFVFVKKKK